MSGAESTCLLGIGDFSRFAMLSVRMLRHHDERGLFVPAHVDPGNGYRFYAPAQLKTAAGIRAPQDRADQRRAAALSPGSGPRTDATTLDPRRRARSTGSSLPRWSEGQARRVCAGRTSS